MTAASWSAPSDAGTIDVNGTFTAGTRAGAFPNAVVVELVDGAAGASASVDVSIRHGTLAKIELRPSFAVVLGGSVQEFVALGFDQFGNEIPGLEFSWEATGGVITQSGIFTAGEESGTYNIEASATLGDGALVGLAAVGIFPAGANAP